MQQVLYSLVVVVIGHWIVIISSTICFLQNKLIRKPVRAMKKLNSLHFWVSYKLMGLDIGRNILFFAVGTGQLEPLRHCTGWRPTLTVGRSRAAAFLHPQPSAHLSKRWAARQSAWETGLPLNLSLFYLTKKRTATSLTACSHAEGAQGNEPMLLIKKRKVSKLSILCWFRPQRVNLLFTLTRVDLWNP